MPALTHFTDSRVSRPRPVDANGEPLSERITEGMPNSLNSASNTGSQLSLSWAATRWQPST